MDFRERLRRHLNGFLKPDIVPQQHYMMFFASIQVVMRVLLQVNASSPLLQAVPVTQTLSNWKVC